MSTKTSLTRRGFVARQVAGAATVAALPATHAMAASSATPASPVGQFNWLTSGAAELSAHLGRRFQFDDETGHRTVMRLVGVEAIDSGADRPADLPRAEGVIAVFDGPDTAPLAKAGSRTYRVSAFGLGSAHVMAGPVPRRDGSHVIEIVLN
ncbi:hypothetical protein [Tateyamaria sp. ANG-S1]|uniref:hypothetical protein n=1 Tax=Tateyamaria sp. ANG-S1 TaxID=1577905 RepID=UPI00057EDE56|nr:hypothetical protein [Tateyamaria sp. ANG-S1]KIC47793.1 hypothetical protein RA29_18960 [Tateyamaria sp. ANG-S1]